MDDKDNQYTVKIGRKTYIVCVKEAETATEPIDSAFRDMCRHEVTGEFSAGDSWNIENLPKSS